MDPSKLLLGMLKGKPAKAPARAPTDAAPAQRIHVSNISKHTESSIGSAFSLDALLALRAHAMAISPPIRDGGKAKYSPEQQH